MSSDANHAPETTSPTTEEESLSRAELEARIEQLEDRLADVETESDDGP